MLSCSTMSAYRVEPTWPRSLQQTENDLPRPTRNINKRKIRTTHFSELLPQTPKLLPQTPKSLMHCFKKENQFPNYWCCDNPEVNQFAFPFARGSLWLTCATRKHTQQDNCTPYFIEEVYAWSIIFLSSSFRQTKQQAIICMNEKNQKRWYFRTTQTMVPGLVWGPRVAKQSPASIKGKSCINAGGIEKVKKHQ